MRSSLIPVAVLLALLGVPLARAALADDGTDDASANDLLVYRHPEKSKTGHNGWPEWWFANRTAILGLSYRVGDPSSRRALVDPDARERARTELLAALRAKSELVRSEAALALGRLGDVRDIGTLAAIVEDPDIQETRRTHRWAAIGLGMLPHGDDAQAGRAREALLEALSLAPGRHEQYSFFWANCAYALAMRGDARALPDLVQLRREGVRARNIRTSIHTDVLGPMCYAIGVLGGELALPEVLEHLAGAKAPDGGSKDTSWAACHSLARMPGEKPTRLLAEAAGDERPTVRRVALAALGSRAGPDCDATVKLLAAAAREDRDEVARQMAIVALGRTGHETAGPVLLSLWGAVRSADRPFVAIALGLLCRERPDASIRKFLRRRLEESRVEHETKALCLACGLAGVVASRGDLAELTAANGRRIPRHACFALGLLDAGPTGRKALLEALDRPGSYLVQREAALALGLLRSPAVVDRLMALAGAEKRADRERAMSMISLGRVGDDRQIDFFLGLLEGEKENAQLRACAIHALGRLLDRTEGGNLAAIGADALWFRGRRGQMPEPVQDIQRLLD